MIRPSRWMEDLRERIEGRRLNQITIPGSHDSATDKLSLKIASHVPSFYKVIPRFIRKWSKCQSLDVSGQLCAGVRYLDIRTVKIKDEFRIVHACVGGPVKDVLVQVKSFVENTTHEIVILDFQHFYGLDENDHALFAAMVKETLGDAWKGDATPTHTLGSMWSTNQRILILSGSPKARALHFLPREEFIHSPCKYLLKSVVFFNFISNQFFSCRGG